MLLRSSQMGSDQAECDEQCDKQSDEWAHSNENVAGILVSVGCHSCNFFNFLLHDQQQCMAYSCIGRDEVGHRGHFHCYRLYIAGRFVEKHFVNLPFTREAEL